MTTKNLLDRHIGSSEKEQAEILKILKAHSLEKFVSSLLPKEISQNSKFQLEEAISEQEFLKKAKSVGEKITFLKITLEWVLTQQSLLQ